MSRVRGRARGFGSLRGFLAVPASCAHGLAVRGPEFCQAEGLLGTEPGQAQFWPGEWGRAVCLLRAADHTAALEPGRWTASLVTLGQKVRTREDPGVLACGSPCCFRTVHCLFVVQKVTWDCLQLPSNLGKFRKVGEASGRLPHPTPSFGMCSFRPVLPVTPRLTSSLV